MGHLHDAVSWGKAKAQTGNPIVTDWGSLYWSVRTPTRENGTPSHAPWGTSVCLLTRSLTLFNISSTVLKIKAANPLIPLWRGRTASSEVEPVRVLLLPSKQIILKVWDAPQMEPVRVLLLWASRSFWKCGMHLRSHRHGCQDTAHANLGCFVSFRVGILWAMLLVPWCLT